MKTILLTTYLLIVIAAISAQCQTNTESNDQWYKNLYDGYRALLEKDTSNHDESQLSDLTKEYFAKSGEKLLMVTVSKKMSDAGKWRILLHWADARTNIAPPAINWGYSPNIHVYKCDDYVMLETNSTNLEEHVGSLYICIVISKLH